jgi:hypothetical protein
MPVGLDSLQFSKALAQDRERQSTDFSRNNLDCLRMILGFSLARIENGVRGELES